MTALSLRISKELVGQIDSLAKSLKLTRSDYIKQAIEHFNQKNEQELFAQALKNSVLEVREQTLDYLKEMDNSTADGLNEY